VLIFGILEAEVCNGGIPDFLAEVGDAPGDWSPIGLSLSSPPIADLIRSFVAELVRVGEVPPSSDTLRGRLGVVLVVLIKNIIYKSERCYGVKQKNQIWISREKSGAK